MVYGLGSIYLQVQTVDLTALQMIQETVPYCTCSRPYCTVKAELYTIVPRSPFLIFVLQNIAGYKNAVECLLHSMKWCYLGHLQLLSKAVAAMAEMEVIPQEEMSNPQ